MTLNPVSESARGCHKTRLFMNPSFGRRRGKQRCIHGQRVGIRSPPSQKYNEPCDDSPFGLDATCMPKKAVRAGMFLGVGGADCLGWENGESGYFTHVSVLSWPPRVQKKRLGPDFAFMAIDETRWHSLTLALCFIGPKCWCSRVALQAKTYDESDDAKPHLNAISEIRVIFNAPFGVFEESAKLMCPKRPMISENRVAGAAFRRWSGRGAT